jgi:NACalpha-BTF3-like transcription factor
MVEPLVDKSGFPRDDIDLVAVRTARSKIICGLTLSN